MDFFDSLVLNILFLLFPISIYIIYVAYHNNLKKKQNDIILDLVNATSIYLIIKFSSYFDSNCFLLLVNLPFIISLFKKRKIASFLIAIVIVGYYHFMYSLPIPIILFEYLLYLFLFSYVFNNNKHYEFIINSFTFIKGIILSIEIIYIIPSQMNFYIILVELFIILITFYIVSNLVMLLGSKSEEIISFNIVLKELEKEKTLKNALFKVTHEVKNPIAVCKGYLSMMNYKDIGQIEKYNNIIKSELDRTLNIMDDFGDYNKIKVNLEVMDLGLLLEETITSMNSLFNSKHLQIKEERVFDEYLINGDYSRLKQALVNILKNSVEASTEQGFIKTKIKETNNKFILSISDTGKGMSKEEVKHLGELFYTTKEKGSGLGVSLSMEIIKLHGGIIKYESKENIGTKAIITLPKYL